METLEGVGDISQDEVCRIVTAWAEEYAASGQEDIAALAVGGAGIQQEKGRRNRGAMLRCMLLRIIWNQIYLLSLEVRLCTVPRARETQSQCLLDVTSDEEGNIRNTEKQLFEIEEMNDGNV